MNCLFSFIGGAFGFLRSGTEDQMGILKKGVFIGIVLGIILGILSMFTPRGISIGAGFSDALDIFVRVTILVIVFMIGVLIGDFLETRRKK